MHVSCHQENSIWDIRVQGFMGGDRRGRTMIVMTSAATERGNTGEPAFGRGVSPGSYAPGRFPPRNEGAQGNGAKDGAVLADQHAPRSVAALVMTSS